MALLLRSYIAEKVPLHIDDVLDKSAKELITFIVLNYKSLGENTYLRQLEGLLHSLLWSLLTSVVNERTIMGSVLDVALCLSSLKIDNSGYFKEANLIMKTCAAYKYLLISTFEHQWKQIKSK